MSMYKDFRTPKQGPFTIFDSDTDDVVVRMNYHLAALVGKMMQRGMEKKGYDNAALVRLAQQLSELDSEASDSEFFQHPKQHFERPLQNYREDDRDYGPDHRDRFRRQHG